MATRLGQAAPRLAAGGRSVLAASISGALVCLATFLGLLGVVLHNRAPSGLDAWFDDRLRGEPPSPMLEVLEHVAALPGSRKGALLLALGAGAWAWFRQRDLRPGVLLIAAFTGATSTVAILKSVVGRASPIHVSEGGEAMGRAFPSAHAADAAAVFGMLAVIVALSRRRDLLALSVATAAVMVTSVGLSVIAAGNHWFTDVLAGAAVAGVWVFALVPPAYLMWARPDLADALQLRRAAPRVDQT